MTPRAPLAVAALATVGYLALLVAGLGFASLWTGSEVIAMPGIDIPTAFVAAGAALVAFGLLLWAALDRWRPSYGSVAGVALASGAVHALVLGVAVLVDTGDLGSVIGVLEHVLIGWVSPVVVLAAAVAAWAAVAIRRTGANPPRWPWEGRGGDGPDDAP
ncbi:hypothetical protein [Microbacterium indicum]|uniref:hypothetical protein n=1 Tax=Microbacterium indicum TaxID=358100 RepID=UPI000424E440|nr:hypothetical protein [Microbacterium indicum]